MLFFSAEFSLSDTAVEVVLTPLSGWVQTPVLHR